MIHVGDCVESLRALPTESWQTCVTSPPYFGLRSYLPADHADKAKEVGLESSPEQFITRLVAVFAEVRRVLRKDGTLWLNIGDSYATTSTYNAPRSSKGEYGRVDGQRQPNAGIPEGVKAKDLIGIPWMLAFALRADGWYLRQDIIWHKPNPMPESVRDRCTKAHEYLFLLSKSRRYYFDSDAMQELASGQVAGNRAVQRIPGERDGENANLRNGLSAFAERQRSKRNSFARATKASPGAHGQKPQHRADRDPIDYAFTRNKRSVWTVPTRPFKGAHFATFPPALIEPCILAGSRLGDIIGDPFMGAGTTAVVAERLGRAWEGCELNPEYAKDAMARIERERRKRHVSAMPTSPQMPLL